MAVNDVRCQISASSALVNPVPPPKSRAKSRTKLRNRFAVARRPSMPRVTPLWRGFPDATSADVLAICLFSIQQKNSKVNKGF
jgi:hypothetical protein